MEVLIHAKFLDRTDKHDLQGRTPPKSAIAKYQEKLRKLGLKNKELEKIKITKGLKTPKLSGSGGLRFRRQLNKALYVS
jgi:hypothetical protein